MSYILTFGKYKNKSLDDIIKEYQSDGYKYLKWIENNQEIKMKTEAKEKITEYLKTCEEPKKEETTKPKIRIDKKTRENDEMIKLKLMTLNFGKYKTITLGEMLKTEEGIKYLKWYVSLEKSNEKLKNIIEKLLKEINI